MSRRGLDVIVVGGGVVGNAAALGLARGGLRVALVEAKSPVPSPPDVRDLRVYAIAPSSSAFLASLGVWPAIRAARAHPYRDMRIWDAGEAGELHFSAADIGADTLGHIVEQASIQEALWSAITQTSNLELRCPASVTSLVQDERGVSVDLADGDRLVAPVLLAADGAASPVRALAGIEVSQHDYGQQGIVAYVRSERPHRDTAWQRFLPGGPLALLPCADGTSSIVWTVANDEAQPLLALDDDAFGRELTRAFDARLGLLRCDSPRAAFPLRKLLAARYVAGRVALLGDAAHVVHPLAGQGVNLGLQDARELVDMLVASRAAGRDPGAAITLRRYERSRRSENAIAATAFGALNRLFSNDATLPTLLRGPALGLMDRLGPIKSLLARHAMGTMR